jgi:hypothetical protein
MRRRCTGTSGLYASGDREGLAGFKISKAGDARTGEDTLQVLWSWLKQALGGVRGSQPLKRWAKQSQTCRPAPHSHAAGVTLSRPPLGWLSFLTPEP